MDQERSQFPEFKNGTDDIQSQKNTCTENLTDYLDKPLGQEFRKSYCKKHPLDWKETLHWLMAQRKSAFSNILDKM